MPLFFEKVLQKIDLWLNTLKENNYKVPVDEFINKLECIEHIDIYSYLFMVLLFGGGQFLFSYYDLPLFISRVTYSVSQPFFKCIKSLYKIYELKKILHKFLFSCFLYALVQLGVKYGFLKTQVYGLSDFILFALPTLVVAVIGAFFPLAYLGYVLFQIANSIIENSTFDVTFISKAIYWVDWIMNGVGEWCSIIIALLMINATKLCDYLTYLCRKKN